MGVACRPSQTTAFLGRRPEPIEASRQPVPVRSIPFSRWQVKRGVLQPLERFEHRTIALAEQPLRDMDPVIGIDADEMSVEGGVVDLR